MNSFTTAEKCKKCGRILAGKIRWWHFFFVSNLCWGHKWKISGLELLKVDEIEAEDVLLISDISKKESKQIRVGDLLEYVRRNNK